MDEIVANKKNVNSGRNLDTQSIIDKWKQSRKEEEEHFQKSLLDEEYIKRLDAIKGQIIKNEPPTAQ